MVKKIIIQRKMQQPNKLHNQKQQANMFVRDTSPTLDTVVMPPYVGSEKI